MNRGELKLKSDRLISLLGRIGRESDEGNKARLLQDLDQETAAVTYDLRRALAVLASTDADRRLERFAHHLDSIDCESIVDLYAHPADAYDDAFTRRPEWRWPDEAFDLAKAAARRALGAGQFADAFLATSGMLCALHGEYLRAEAAFNAHSEAGNKEQAIRRERDLPRPLGQVRSAKSGIRYLVEGKYISTDEGQRMIEALAEAEAKIRAPYADLEIVHEPHRTRLGQALIDLFHAVGFDQKRGVYTKDGAAQYAVALAAQYRILLRPNTLRTLRPQPSSS